MAVQERDQEILTQDEPDDKNVLFFGFWLVFFFFFFKKNKMNGKIKCGIYIQQNTLQP